MQTRILLAITFTLALCRPALAGDKYTFHENLHVGQKIPFSMIYDYKIKSTSTTNAVPTVTDTVTHFDWKVTLTILAEKDGSATKAQADIDPKSSDTVTIAGSAPSNSPVKSTCPFAGKSITLTRNPDESFTNDFPGNAGDVDAFTLNNFLSPDEDYYPDQPVSVGDIWDPSAKLSKHSQLGPHDRLLAQCRLDWVKTINGKPMAQISNSTAIAYHEPGHVEEDVEGTATLLVDLSTQMITKADQTGTSQYKTPPTEPTQMTGGTEFTFHDEVLGN